MLAGMIDSTDALLLTTVPQVPAKSQLGLGGSQKETTCPCYPSKGQQTTRKTDFITTDLNVSSVLNSGATIREHTIEYMGECKGNSLSVFGVTNLETMSFLNVKN